MRRILLTAVALALTLTVPASATSLRARVVETVPVGTRVQTDHERWLAWARGSDAVVRDAATGAQRVVAAAPGCTWHGLGAGVLIFGCPVAPGPVERGYTVDLRSGVMAPLPVVRPTGSADTGQYAGVGARWAIARVNGYHVSGRVYVDRLSGRQVDEPAADVHVRIDPDAPRLTARLCRPVLRPEQPDDDSGLVPVPGPISVVGRWTAANYAKPTDPSQQRIQLQRCGHRPVVLAARSSEIPQLDDRRVAWLEQSHGSRPLLSVRSLRTGRTRTVRLPPSSTPGLPASIALVAHRLFVADGTQLLRITG